MTFKRSGQLLAALGCAAIVSLVAPVAAHATEPAPVEAVEVEAAQAALAAQAAQAVEAVEAAEADKPVFTGTLRPATPDAKYAYQVQATAPAGTSLTFTASGLPAGYSITSGGLITGQIDAKPGSYPVTITATANAPGRAPVSSSVTWTLVVAEPERPVLADIVLPPAIHDTPYSYRVAAKAPLGRPSLTFTATRLPEGYSMSEDGVISGRLNSLNVGKFTVTIGVTAHAAGRPPVTGQPISVTFEVLRGTTDGWFDPRGDRHKVIFDGGIKWGGYRIITGDCGAGWFLDKNTGTAGMRVGQGFLVEHESWVTISEQDEGKLGSRVMAYLPGLGKHEAVQAMSFEVLNGLVNTTRGLKIEMVCTQDNDRAWRG
jgi:hypothetical protein